MSILKAKKSHISIFSNQRPRHRQLGGPMIPYIKDRLMLNDAQLGLVLLIFGIGAMISMPMTGWLIHRFGSRLLGIASGLAMAFLLPLLAIAGDVKLLSCLILLFGGAQGMSNISINTHAVTVEIKYTQPIMSRLHCLFSFGGLAGASFISVQLNASLSLLLSALNVSALILSIIVLQARHLLPASEDIRVEKSNDKLSFPERKVLLLGILCFICFTVEGAVLDWSAVYLNQSLGYTAAMAGIGYACFSVAMSTARFFGDQVIQKITPVIMVQAGSALAAAGLLSALFPPFPHAELFGFILIGLGAANIVPILFSSTGKLSSISPGASLSIVTSMGYLGILLGPVMIGFVADAATLTSALSGLAAGMMLVCLNARIIAPSQALQEG